jgi:hypothetical protein
MHLIENIPKSVTKYEGCDIYKGVQYDLFVTYEEKEATEYCMKNKYNLLVVYHNKKNNRYYIKDSKYINDPSGNLVEKSRPASFNDIKKVLDSNTGQNKYPNVTTYLFEYN